MAGVEITNLTRRHLQVVAGLPFKKVAASVIPDWDVSLVFVGPAKARELNEQLRGKTYTPNVLSYEVSEKSGEIFICLHEAAKQAPEHGMHERVFVLYLFIHGLLHLKGMAHGSTMERCEQKLVTRFSTPHETTHSDRH